MSANHGPPRKPDWVTDDMLKEASSMSVSRSGPAQRSGRSTTSTRGRGPAMTSARPMPPHTTSYNSPPSARPARVPGTTQSGNLHPHWGGGANYSVGPSTPAPVFKSAPKEKSPTRGGGRGLDSVPTAKPKSPPKLRSSILVSGYTQPMPSLVNSPHLGAQGQPDFGQSAYGQVEPVRNPDPRFMTAESFQPMAQQPTPTYSVNGESIAVSQSASSAPAAPQFGGSASTFAGQHPTPTGERIETNWSNDDPKKPIIPGYMKQDAKLAVQECAASGGWTVSEISSDGVSIGGGTATLAGLSGIQDSIHAPGYAGANRGFPQHQSDVSSRTMKSAYIKAQRSAAGNASYGDGDVEMSDGPYNIQSSAPQGPVEWNNMPTLSSSKYATAPSFVAKITAPKSTPVHDNKENVKPASQGQVGNFYHNIAKNIAAEIAQSSASNNVGGFGAAAQNVKSNPFLANGAHTSQNSSSNAFGAPSVPNAVLWGSFDHSAPKASAGYGAAHPATNASSAWGSVNNATSSGQTSVGVAQSATPTGNTWESADHSVSNGQTGISAARPAVLTSNAWGSTGNFASNAQNGIGGAQYNADTSNAWGSVGYAATNAQAGNAQAGNAQTSFGGDQSMAAAAGSWGSANQVAQNNTGIQPGYMANGTAAKSTPHVTGGWGSTAHSATNVQHNQGSPSPTGFGASQNAGNFQAGGSAAFQPVNSGQEFHNPSMANSAVSGAGQPVQKQANMNDWGAAATNDSQPKQVFGMGGLDMSSIMGNIAKDIHGMVQGDAAAKLISYHPTSTGQQAIRPPVAPNAFNGQQNGQTQYPRYQVAPETKKPETKKPAGLADSRWA